jgi:uncharacterized repeat protein (TIGR01451 family)
MPEIKPENVFIHGTPESDPVAFIKKPLPSEAEVRAFEGAVSEEKRQYEIEDDLMEIYGDDRGSLVDVKTIKIKKKRGFFSRALSFLLVLGFLSGLGYGLYYYMTHGRSTGDNLEVTLTAPKAVSVGEEFYYTVDYHNVSDAALHNVKLEITYPDNFIFLESQPQNAGQNNWSLPDLAPNASASVKIKGQIINNVGTDNIFVARVSYNLDKYSTQFEKEASASISVKDLGFDLAMDYVSSALAGDDNSISLTFSNFKGLIPEFDLIMSGSDNFSFGTSTPTATDGLKVVRVKDGVWHISGLDQNTAFQVATLNYKVKEKRGDKETLKIDLEATGADNQVYGFYEKAIDLDIIKSDLSLSLELNGGRTDQAVNFGDPLNYVVYYSNKGNATMKDVVLSAVLDGDLVDWTALKDKNNGERHGSAITWTKDQIPSLAELQPGAEGQITFSAAVLAKKVSGPTGQITAYAQYSIGNSEQFSASTDTSSNKIVSVINSNLNFNEEFRYFDENNIPVGAGPLPPKSGEKTSLKVYWTLTNDLHDLNDVQVQMVLANGIEYDSNNRTSAGTVDYDPSSRTVTWTLGRLPSSVGRATAEFNIALTPTEADVNRIIVIGNGSTATALDTDTGQTIQRISRPKTTKLEDDDIANMNNDGRVR